MRRGQKLGQHFLNAQWVARDLAHSLHIKPAEPILEIGPGRGALTKELLTHSTRVIAIEKDTALTPVLEEEFMREVSTGALTVIEEDIREIEPRQLGLTNQGYVVAANIPYYITGEIIRRFLETSTQPRAMALLIQKEVAERAVARDRKESMLSISVKAYGVPSVVATVSRTCFNPPPSVDSAILLISDISRDFFKHMPEEAFFAAVRAGFASKRKQIGGNMRKIFGDRALTALDAAGIKPTARAEDISLHEWKKIAEELLK